MKKHSFKLIEIFFFAVFASCGICLADDPETIDFNGQIRPILSRHCIACHGPDEEDRQADLRLDTFSGATEYSIVPGDAEGSEFFERITTKDEDLRMPPVGHADGLKDSEIALLKAWVNQGAKYATHWSFAPVSNPPAPKISAPETEAFRINNEIDNFILQGIRKAGLSQNTLAKPASLVRRVSLDLTGLPPIAQDHEVQQAIAAFIKEPTQTSFGTLVDQLLNTSAYAEHSAAVWLDLARYADTCGYSGDERRDIWPWRDWLISSIQKRTSYKSLSIQMIAGDMLPDATTDQKLATAFHRNTLSNNEGGTDDEEFRTIAVKDRLSTTINAWMGLTVRCAECHSHKYDPISQVEYYELLDFFNQTADSDHRDDRPKLEVHALVDPVKANRLNVEIKKLQDLVQKEPEVWSTISPSQKTSREGTKFRLLEDGSILPFGPNPEREEYQFEFQVPAGSKINAIRLEAIPHVNFNGNVGRANDGAFLLSQVRIASLDNGQEPAESILKIANAANDFNQVNRHAREAIHPEVESGGNQGWGVNHPRSGYKAHHEAIFELAKPFVSAKRATLKIYLLFDPPWVRLNMGRLRLSSTASHDAVSRYNNRSLDDNRRKLNLLLNEQGSPVRVPIMEQLPEERQRKTFVNLRGNFRSKGQQVSASFPKAFQPSNKELTLDRLGLAEWLFDDANPLTARVAANRYWARLMGAGLVETEEDFGTQGTPPSNPELLDFLATRFVESDWDTRALQKMIVMSATYQQSQIATAEALSADPRNRLLARGPRVRLTAEVVRDQALAVAGLLSKKMFGPPVYPPSPVKDVVNAFTGGTKWQESQGEDRYRRALYTFYKRSSPHPLFETFDISSRDVCSMRRLRTNTPLQSFMTLNDITFIEAARSMASEMQRSTKTRSETRAQISFGLMRALYVEPSQNQIEVLEKLYESAMEKYSTDLSLAAELNGQTNVNVDRLSDEDKFEMSSLAALTLVANAILNLDSFLNN